MASKIWARACEWRAISVSCGRRRAQPAATARPLSAARARRAADGMGLRGALAPSGIGVTIICPGYVQSEMVDAISAGGTSPRR
jgi:NAD(P)-dependent dehydrogenase (short-subunit alcohol dehydrogenase family)